MTRGSDNPAVLVELLNLPAGAEEAWRKWDDRTYLAARASLPGVVAARRGVGVVGSVKEIALYDLADAAVVETPGWREVDDRIAAGEAGAGEYQAYRANVTSILYRQISTSVESYRPPKAEVLHSAFFEAEPQHHDEFNDWYALEHIPAILNVPGYLNVRRYQGVEDNRKFLALYDVRSLEDAEGKAAFSAMQSGWSDRIRAKIATYRERRPFRIERVMGE